MLYQILAKWQDSTWIDISFNTSNPETFQNFFYDLIADEKYSFQNNDSHIKYKRKKEKENLS